VLPLLAVGLLAAACQFDARNPIGHDIGGHQVHVVAPGGVLSAACDTQTPAAQLTGAGANSISPSSPASSSLYNKANPKVTDELLPGR